MNKFHLIDSNNASIKKMEKHISKCQEIVAQLRNETNLLLAELTTKEWSNRGPTGSLDAARDNPLVTARRQSSNQSTEPV
jgi:hypothetical protein